MNQSLSRASLWTAIVLATLASAGSLARAELVVDPQAESGAVTSADSQAAAPVATQPTAPAPVAQPVVQQVAVPAQSYPVQPIVIAAPAAPAVAQAPARNSRRKIFPTLVLGSSSRNSMYLGTL